MQKNTQNSDFELIEKLKTDRNNKKLALKVVNIYWWNLKYASDELRNDREVVLLAVNNNWWAIKYASNNLKNDKKILLAYILKSYYKKPSAK